MRWNFLTDLKLEVADLSSYSSSYVLQMVKVFLRVKLLIAEDAAVKDGNQISKRLVLLFI